MENDFEGAINQYITWGLIIAFVYLVFKYKDFRPIGYAVGAVVLAAALYREMFTVLLSGKYWASALIILGASYLGHLKDKGYK